jgi:DNA-binding LytR/AlgR family response regulator
MAMLGGCGSTPNTNIIETTTQAQTEPTPATTTAATAASTTTVSATTTSATTTAATTAATTTAITTTTTTEKATEAVTTAHEAENGGASSITPGDIKPVEASKENPAKVGEWVETKRYNTLVKEDRTIYFRITDILYGESAQTEIDAYNENSRRQYTELDDPDLGYYVIVYDVYFPEDYPAETYGITSTDITFYAKNPDGGGIKFNGRSYIGLGSSNNISESLDINVLYPGGTWTGKSLFTMVKNFSDYEIECYYFEDSTQISSFITPPAIDGAAGSGIKTAERQPADPAKAYKIETSIRKGAAGDIAAKEASEESPASIGDWIEITRNNSVSRSNETIYVRVNDILRGEAAQATVDAYNETARRQFNEIEDPLLEYCVIIYEVYFPENYSAEDYGISSANLYFTAANPKGGGIPSSVGAYIGLGGATDMSSEIVFKSLHPGDIWTGMATFAMVTDYHDYVLRTDYYKLTDELLHAYIKGK